MPLLLLLLSAPSLACTPNPVFTGIAPGVDGATDVPTDWRIEIAGNIVPSTILVDDLGNPGPELFFEHNRDFYDAPALFLVPATPMAPATTYTLTAWDDNYGTLVEDSATFTTGAQPSRPPVAPRILSAEVGDLGQQTNDCVVGTHEPRDLTVVVDVPEAEPWSRIELRNDDLRIWVSQPLDGPGEHTLDVFQPVMDEDFDKTDCYTAFVVNPAGAAAESLEFCRDPKATQTSCSCAHQRPTPLFLLLLPLLIRRRRPC